MRRITGEEREQCEEEGGLVVDSAIVRGDVMFVEKQSFLYCKQRISYILRAKDRNSHIS